MKWQFDDCVRRTNRNGFFHDNACRAPVAWFVLVPISKMGPAHKPCVSVQCHGLCCPRLAIILYESSALGCTCCTPITGACQHHRCSCAQGATAASPFLGASVHLLAGGILQGSCSHRWHLGDFPWHPPIPRHYVNARRFGWRQLLFPFYSSRQTSSLYNITLRPPTHQQARLQPPPDQPPLP